MIDRLKHIASAVGCICVFPIVVLIGVLFDGDALDEWREALIDDVKSAWSGEKWGDS